MKSKSSLLQIAELGNSVIRETAKEISNIDPEIHQLIKDMIATVKEVDGVGISACQVYQPLRLLILASHPSPRYPKAPKMKPTAIINPKIISYSKSKNKKWEGCLSVPGIRGQVPRANSIKVEYLDSKGEKNKRQFKGFIARIFQHEFDHLEGKVILDRVEGTQDLITEKEYQKGIRKRI